MKERNNGDGRGGMRQATYATCRCAIAVMGFLSLDGWTFNFSRPGSALAATFRGPLPLPPPHKVVAFRSFEGTLALNPDGSWVAAVGWSDFPEVRRGAILLKIPKGNEKRRPLQMERIPNCLLWSPDGKIIACGGSGWDASHERRQGVLLLMDGNTGTTLRSLIGHRQAVRDLAFSPNGKILASGSADETVRLWDVASGKEIHTLKGQMALVIAIAFSPDGSQLLATDENGKIHVWDVARGELVASVQTDTEAIPYVASHPSKNLFAVVEGQREGQEFVYRVALWELRAKTQLIKLSTLNKSRHRIRSVLFHTDGSHLAVADEDGMVHIWNLEKKKIIYSLNHADPVHALSFSADGKFLGVTTGRWLTIWKFGGKMGD